MSAAQNTDEEEKRIRLSMEIAHEFRDLHKHENELMNHRFQWFGLMTGLLAASYGLMWEFKSSAEMPMLFICLFGLFVAVSATRGALLTRDAHRSIDAQYLCLLRKNKLKQTVPVRGFVGDRVRSQKHLYLLPWRSVFPAFAVLWICLAFCAWLCPCPPCPP